MKIITLEVENNTSIALIRESVSEGIDALQEHLDECTAPPCRRTKQGAINVLTALQKTLTNEYRKESRKH